MIHAIANIKSSDDQPQPEISYVGPEKLFWMTRKLAKESGILRANKIRMGTPYYRIINNSRPNGIGTPFAYVIPTVISKRANDEIDDLYSMGFITCPEDILVAYFSSRGLEKISNDYLPNPEKLCGLPLVTGNVCLANLIRDFSVKNWNSDLTRWGNSINLFDEIIGIGADEIREYYKELDKNLKIIESKVPK